MYNMNLLKLLAAVLGTSTLLLVGGCGSSSTPPVPAPSPLPPILRSDLLYGYYGDELEETKDHTNLFFAVAWVDLDTQLQQLVSAAVAGKKLMVDMAPQIGLPFNALEAISRVRSRLEQFRSAGILQAIAALYPLDEPDLHGMSSVDVNAMHNMVRSVANEFGISPAIAVVYSASQTYPGIESANWVGFDNYDAGNGIFTNGDITSLKARLRPEQKIILVPDGRINPGVFLSFAENNAQVCCLIPFAWNSFGGIPGIRSNGMGEVYRTTGKTVIHPLP